MSVFSDAELDYLGSQRLGWPGTPAVKVGAGRTRQNVDRVVDQQDKLGQPDSPDRNLVLPSGSSLTTAKSECQV